MNPPSDSRSAAPAADPKGISEVASELWELTTSYAKQETLDPLKGLGRFLGYGISGAVALGIGTSLMLLGGLRALQTQTGTSLTGNLSWLPYLIVVVACLVLAALAVRRVSKRKGPDA